MTSIVSKFKRSAFNAFYTDPERGVVMGHWEVEQGYEEYGAFAQAEIFYIVEGTATVQTDDGDLAVGSCDVVLMLAGRRCRFLIEEPVNVFYVTSGAQDINKMQEVGREAAGQ